MLLLFVAIGKHVTEMLAERSTVGSSHEDDGYKCGHQERERGVSGSICAAAAVAREKGDSPSPGGGAEAAGQLWRRNRLLCLHVPLPPGSETKEFVSS